VYHTLTFFVVRSWFGVNRSLFARKNKNKPMPLHSLKYKVPMPAWRVGTVRKLPLWVLPPLACKLHTKLRALLTVNRNVHSVRDRQPRNRIAVALLRVY
jgi:hypothetical protein